jgi:hypothetical protein
MMETRQLDNSELKRLVPVLRGVSSPGPARLEAYNNTIKESIKALPRRMKQPYLSGSSNLCRTHKGLSSNLISEVWSWIQHEFDSGIGKHVFPVIMSNKLTVVQENKIRQLEPVLQMWCKDFKTETSAPPGRNSIYGGSQWTYQTDQCPACMLARIGSDEKVLFALYAGMIGRFPLCKLTSRGAPLTELRASKLGDPKSKRVRFVRYWIKACFQGDTLLHDATELGIVLKKIHKEWKDGRKEKPNIYRRHSDSDGATSHGSMGSDPFSDNNRASTEGSERPQTAAGPEYQHSTAPESSSRQHSVRRSSANIAIDMNDPYQYQDWSQPQSPDPKIGPRPRSAGIHPNSPVEPLGFKVSGHRIRDSTASEASRPLLDPDSDSDDTVYPEDSISVAPLRVNKPPPRPRTQPLSKYKLSKPFLEVPGQPSRHSKSVSSKSSHPPPHPASSVYSSHTSSRTTRPEHPGSFASTATIQSYDGGEGGFPIPEKSSMYFRYGDEQGDPFEDADEDAEEGERGLLTPIVEDGMEKTDSVVTTSWDKLY